MDAWNEMLEAEKQALAQDTATEDPEDETAILDSDDDMQLNFFYILKNSKFEDWIPEKLRISKNFENLKNSKNFKNSKF